MNTTPTETPRNSRSSDLRLGFFIGGGVVLASALAWASTSGLGSVAPPDFEGLDRTADSSYPSPPATGALEPAAPRPEVTMLPGFVPEDGELASFEAILRLHTWLGLRDLHTGSAALVWTPALRRPDADPVVEEDCAADGDPVGDARLLSSPPSIPYPEAPAPVFVRLALHPDPRGFRLEGFVCSPGGRVHRQVVRDSRERLGRAQRELLTWLATRLSVTDTTSWENDWGRDPAPAGPLRRGYGLALRASLGESPAPTAALSDAAPELAEAAWLVAALSEDPKTRELELRRAAALRVGFTAALEDLSALRLAQDRVDLARAALKRLRRPAEGARPVEWGLAHTRLANGDPTGARRLLESLPPWLFATQETAALQARILLKERRPERALEWVDAWVAVDSTDGHARLLRGRILETLERHPEAAKAYARAADANPEIRDEALQRWVVMKIQTGQEYEVGRRLSNETLEPSETLTEMRAFAAFRDERPADAFRDYERLARLRPDVQRHRENRCVTALAAGLVPAEPDPCRDLPEGALSTDLLRAAAISRLPDRSVNQFLELMDRAERAGRDAPLDPIAADALLEVVGPFRDETERKRLQGMWRIAVGGDRRLTAAEEPEAGTEEVGATRLSDP